MQKKLSLWAEQDKSKRFYDLGDLLHQDEWIRTAQKHVRQNVGSRTAGCDGVTMRDFERDLEGNLAKLRKALKGGEFEPQPVRRTYIAEVKAGGRIKQRPLGIPDIEDRIVQEALRMVLEPIWEADFSRNSYGFRPNRSTWGAGAYIGARLTSGKSTGYGWVIEGDIQSFFDTIDHYKLMQLVRKRIKDEKLLDLIWHFLRAGIMEQGRFRHSLLGTPQGGLRSPLLANIYLHELDQYMERYTELPQRERQRRRYWRLANFLYVRYADDWVVLCDGTREQAEALRQELYEYLRTELKLELSMEKTRVTHVSEGFVFLGYHIERGIGASGRWVPRIRIPAKAVEKVRGKIRTALKPNTHKDSVGKKILGLNRIIGGWCRYYQVTSSPSRIFSGLSDEVYWAMAHWLGRKYKMSTKRGMRRFRVGNTYGTGRTMLKMPSGYEAMRRRVRATPNPYTSKDATIQREDLDDLGEEWTGNEGRKGQEDRKEVVYQRDQGLCGICGNFVPWEEADLDHIIPRWRFDPPESGDRLENQQVLHRDPCHKMKTKRDQQGGRRLP
jgi:RNA-directed DNA polymerase